MRALGLFGFARFFDIKLGFVVSVLTVAMSEDAFRFYVQPSVFYFAIDFLII